MIYPGTDLKFKIVAVCDWIDLQEQDFEITVRDQYGRVALQLTKSDCFRDEDGNLYFTLENPLQGAYNAYFVTSVADGDFSKHERVVKDACELVKVGACGYKPDMHYYDHLVGYELVWTADVKERED